MSVRLKQSEVTPELSAEAVALLPIFKVKGEGAFQIFESEGKWYEARAEWHAPGPRNPTRHIGVSLFHADPPDSSELSDDVVWLPEVVIYGSVEIREPGLPAVPGIERTTHEFRVSLLDMCHRLGAGAQHMVTTMSFESGLNPAARNRMSKATGLIQFMPNVAKSLGTTVDELAKMTAFEQLPYVEKYFQPYRGPHLKTLEGTYLSVFYPAARAWPLDRVVGKVGSKVWEQNKIFDLDGDGIEVGEICTVIRRHAAKAGGKRVAV